MRLHRSKPVFVCPISVSTTANYFLPYFKEQRFCLSNIQGVDYQHLIVIMDCFRAKPSEFNHNINLLMKLGSHEHFPGA